MHSLQHGILGQRMTSKWQQMCYEATPLVVLTVWIRASSHGSKLVIGRIWLSCSMISPLLEHLCQRSGCKCLLFSCQKRPLITEPKHTRPIGISPIFCKLYDKLLTDLLKPYLSQLPSWICGFRPGMGANDTLWLAFQSSEKMREWRKPLAFLKVDVCRAFDSLPHQAIFGGLHLLQVPEVLVQAILKFCEWEADLYLDHISIGHIPITNGVRQGAHISPLLWVVGLWYILRDLISDWHRDCIGCSLDDALLHIIIYADDILLLAGNLDDLQHKSASLQARLQLHSMQVSVPKLELLLNEPWQALYGKHATILDQLCTSGTCMGYLGTMLSFNGRTGDAFEHALARGWRSFHSRSKQLFGSHRYTAASASTTVWLPLRCSMLHLCGP
eukprot:6491002-Amphidinium_carterae.3